MASARWSNGNDAGGWEYCGGTLDCLRAMGHPGDHRPRLQAVLLSPARCSGCGASVYWGRRRSWRDYPPRWREMNHEIHRCGLDKALTI